MPHSITYLHDMYQDSYFPDFLVDKIKAELQGLEQFLQAGPYETEEVQAKLDDVTIAINGIQEEFFEHNSDIETVGRDSIAVTVEQILQAHGIEIDLETALQERDW